MVKTARKNDRIRITETVELPEDGRVIFPLNSEWVVKSVLFPRSGTVFVHGNKYGVSHTQYEIIGREKTNT